jgi:hypothetical protein
MVCLVLSLLLASASSSLALDPGDGTTISAQQLRRPVGASDKIVPLDLGGRGLSADKAELSVYQVYAMHFGTLCDNSGYVVLGTNDAITQDPDHLVYGGTPFSAEIRLNGDAFRAVSVSIAAGSASGFTLSAFETSYGTPPLSGITLDATGYLTFDLGARLDISAGDVDPGSGQQIGYTVTAVYE